ncbi:unnamed protein product [Polarella glacialis]|uniref:NAD(P)-binding domain-containing protein n=1 Tax=Polarella glacialis TaxID=89957 RepID=A0A813H2J6_POLGL|nr:unnamed protein product [Polarella glacialis]
MHSAFAVFLLLLVAANSSGLPVAVIGATGKLGRHAVQKLVQQGCSVRCLVRCAPSSAAKPSNAQNATSAEVAAWLTTLPGVELVEGDVTDRQCVMELLRGCSACLALHGARRTTKLSDLLPWVDATREPAHAKQVNYEGVRHVIEAARASGTCKRIVRVTGKGETPWSIFSILINGLGSMAKAWNYEGERLLRACDDIDYTIVRPGYMGQVDAQLEGASLVLADNGGDLKVSGIPHSSVAQLCVRCLDFPNAARSTLCAMTAPKGQGADSFDPLLAEVAADTRRFAGGELFKRHVLAVRVGGLVMSGFAVGFVGGSVSVLRAALAMLTR